MMLRESKYLVLFFVLLTNTIFAQHIVNYQVELSEQYASKDRLPFWLTANQYGTIPNQNSGVAKLKLFADDLLLLKNITFDYGASLLRSRGAKSDFFFFDEIYVNAHWRKWKFSLGMQHRDIVYSGLSVTNNDMLYSGNARMYPELKLALKEYIAIPYTDKWAWIKGTFSNGIMLDNRYVDKTNVHHLHLDLRIGKAKGLALTCGFDHYVQWGGKSPRWGNMGGMKNFLAAVFIQSGSVLKDKNGNISTNDSRNKAGNHIGQNTFDISYTNESVRAVLGFKNIYDDKSGDYLFLGSVRDWNIDLYIELKQQKWLTAFLYEFFQSKDQGGYFIQPEVKEEPVIGFDNYFSNGIYRSGWSSYGRIIGIPLFTPTYDKNGIVNGMFNNALNAHHFGITGFLGKVKYKAMFTFSENYGIPYLVYNGKGIKEENYSKAYTFGKPLSQQSYLLELQLPKWKNFPFVVATTLALDNGDFLKDNLGFQLKLTSTGFLRSKK